METNHSKNGLNMTQMEPQVVRFNELKPCKTAFIDAHTPGSDEKDNFTIIGSGVSESPDQYVHISQTPGFNIGAAGQPPKCINSLHSHTTAEVFFVLNGRWRFFWGRWGTAGEVIVEEGDIFNIPTGMFRAFENIGSDYGMLMAILGGDDAGGGVTWAPQVIEEAKKYGLILGENGLLYDVKKGESLPNNINPVPLLTEEELKSFPEIPSEDVVRNYVARYSVLTGLAESSPVKVIGEEGLLKDRPGFEIDFLTGDSSTKNMYSNSRHEVLMIMKGHWNLSWDGGNTVLGPGDTCSVPPSLEHQLLPANSKKSSLFRVTNTDDPAGSTWRG
jgi:mannose-6-phosphate isomerase-like protein (cupin superfamily)